jgi:hypothetical protein
MKKRKRKNPHAVALGRLGGLVRSEAKRLANRQKWPQGRPGQKPQEKDSGPAQRAASSIRSPQELIEIVIAAIRFGHCYIGLGDRGIRFVGGR